MFPIACPFREILHRHEFALRENDGDGIGDTNMELNSYFHRCHGYNEIKMTDEAIERHATILEQYLQSVDSIMSIDDKFIIDIWYAKFSSVVKKSAKEDDTSENVPYRTISSTGTVSTISSCPTNENEHNFDDDIHYIPDGQSSTSSALDKEDKEYRLCSQLVSGQVQRLNGVDITPVFTVDSGKGTDNVFMMVDLPQMVLFKWSQLDVWSRRSK